jgi:hypothetical protein
MVASSKKKKNREMRVSNFSCLLLEEERKKFLFDNVIDVRGENQKKIRMEKYENCV